MKKIQYTLTALAALTFLFSCSPAQLEEASGSNGRAMVFTAVSARNVPDTKTELKDNGPDVWWSAADAIHVFQGTEGARFVSTNTEPALQAQFRGYLTASTGASSFWAVYPYTEANASDGSGITTTVPANQQAQATTFDPSALVTVAYTDNLTLAFQHVCGGLKFQVTQDWIQQVELRSNDGTPLAGRITVGMDASGHPEVTAVQDASDAVRLTAPYGETFESGQWYYLACLPAALTQGYTLTFRSENQTGVKVHNGGVVVERSAWGKLSAADAGVVPEAAMNSLYDNVIYYTTTDGNVIQPGNDWGFGASILSNTYENGRGIIRFDGPVTKIPGSAFDSQLTLASIVLPTAVKEIGGWAFSTCGSLQSVSLPEGLEIIGDYAFQNSHLTEVTLPGGLHSVSPNAFRGCNDLSVFHGPLATSDGRGLVIDGILTVFAQGGLESPLDYEVEAGITGLADRVFDSVWQLREVTLPNSVETIGNEVFSYCGNLRAFNGKFASQDGHLLIKDGRILASALLGVTEFEVPGSVRIIDDHAFSQKYNLQSLTISEGVQQIKEYAFIGCSNLREVSLPNSLTELGKSAFEGCWNINVFSGKYATTDGKFLIRDGILLAVAGNGKTSIVVPDGVTALAPTVFYNSPFATITLPDGLTEIGEFAFGWNYSLTGLTLPESLRTIGSRAFYGCQNEAFTTLTIPSGVTEVGEDILDNCAYLVSIWVLPDTPPTTNYYEPLGWGSNAVEIWVPSASLSAYQQADGWRNHASYYKAITE